MSLDDDDHSQDKCDDTQDQTGNTEPLHYIKDVVRSCRKGPQHSIVNLVTNCHVLYPRSIRSIHSHKVLYSSLCEFIIVERQVVESVYQVVLSIKVLHVL
jgi:hypothetical protein